MIRIHLIMILVLCQAVFSERLVLQLATGGRGMILVTNLVSPWITLALVLLPFWSDLRRTFWTNEFVLYWMPYLALTFLLPLLGVALADYPARSAFASWNALDPMCFLVIGAAGVFHLQRAGKVIQRYFMFAVLAQLGLAIVQTMGQYDYLPGILKSIYNWDFTFKAVHQLDNIILARATGFYLNPNSLGIWALLAFWTSFFLLHGKQRFVGCVASFGTILLCQSRGSLAGLLGSGAIYGASWTLFRADRNQRRKATLFIAILAVPILMLSAPGLTDATFSHLREVPLVGSLLERYTSGAKVVSQGASADASFQVRTDLWQLGYEYLVNHPFGSLGSPEMGTKVPQDNQFISALEQGSFYFFGALLLMFFGGVRLINSPLVASRLLAVASLGLMVNGISAVPFSSSASHIFWLLVGVALAQHVKLKETALLAEVYR